MTWPEYLVMKILEECNEIAQRCSKALLFGLSEIQNGQSLTNAERITLEANDLIGVLRLAAYYGVVNIPAYEDAHFRANNKVVSQHGRPSRCWTWQEYVLRIQKECNEVALLCSTGLLFGLAKKQEEEPLTGAERIALKTNDLIGILHHAANDDVVIFPDDEGAHLRKIQKVIYHAEYSRDRGTLI